MVTFNFLDAYCLRQFKKDAGCRNDDKLNVKQDDDDGNDEYDVPDVRS